MVSSLRSQHLWKAHQGVPARIFQCVLFFHVWECHRNSQQEFRWLNHTLPLFPRRIGFVSHSNKSRTGTEHDGSGKLRLSERTTSEDVEQNGKIFTVTEASGVSWPLYASHKSVTKDYIAQNEKRRSTVELDGQKNITTGNWIAGSPICSERRTTAFSHNVYIFTQS